MALTVIQRIALQKQTQTFAAKILAAQFVGSARMVLAEEPPKVDPSVTQKAKDQAGENKFFKDATKFVKHDDAAGLINDLEDGRKDLEHTFDWLASYFKQLRPLIEKFTKRMIKFDPAGINKTQLQQLMGVVGAVLRLAEVLDAAGATASDIIEMTQQMEATLRTKPSDDRKKSGLRNLFGK